MDQYFDSCVFDLMTTGDANFTLAASSALKVRHRVILLLINEVGQSSYAMNSAYLNVPIHPPAGEKSM